MKLTKYNGKIIKNKVVNNVIYFCATDMEKATKVRLKDWRRLEETKETLLALQEQLGYCISNSHSWYDKWENSPIGSNTNDTNNYLIEVSNGTDRGTWFHEDVAIAYAYNCNVDFRLWVINLVKDTLKGAKTLPFSSGTHTYIYRPLEEGRSAWELTFEKPFFDQLYALDNRENKEPYHQHPPYMAKYIIKYVYDQLKPYLPKKQVYTEVRLLKQHDRPKGIRMLHQYLSPEGKVELFKLIGALIEIFRDVNYRTSDPILKKQLIEVKLAERNGQLRMPIYDECLLNEDQKLIKNYNDFHHQVIEKVIPLTTKSFLRQSVKILEINHQNIIFGVKSDFLKSIGHRQKSEIELAIEAILNKNLSVMFKTYEEYLFGEVSERDQKTNIQDYQQPF